jgi:hypothetical protein
MGHTLPDTCCCRHFLSVGTEWETQEQNRTSAATKGTSAESRFGSERVGRSPWPSHPLNSFSSSSDASLDDTNTSNWEGEYYRKLGLRERERGGVGRGNNTPLKDLVSISCRWGQNGENTPEHLLPPRGLVPGLIVVVR